MFSLLLAATLDLAPYARDGHALASAVVRDGRVERTGTHGAPAGAVFRMASLSKVVTAYVVVQLAEEGRVDLHADVARYLPDVPLRRHRGGLVTLDHLLTVRARLRTAGHARFDIRAAAAVLRRRAGRGRGGARAGAGGAMLSTAADMSRLVIHLLGWRF